MSEFQWNISPFVRHEQMNVKTAILDGEFEDKIFIK